MSTTYDFLLQLAGVGRPFEAEAVETALAERGAARRGDGAWVWTFARGEVVALPMLEGGRVAAFELKVPLLEDTQLVSAVLPAAVALAESLELQVVDPQLNRAVRITDEGSVIDAYLRAARYAGEYLGVSAALGATTLAAPPEEKVGVGGRVMLALAVFAVALYFTYRALVA